MMTREEYAERCFADYICADDEEGSEEFETED
jgi:hypothetical protein